MSTVVFVAPSALSFSCLCEPCLEDARVGGLLFADALMLASVRGSIERDADVSLARCSAGHEVVVRRNERPPGLHRHDERQLQIA